MVVVDDALLLGIIANQQVAPIQPYLEAASRGEVFTTGSWYRRLSRALAQPGQGALCVNSDRRVKRHHPTQEPPPEP